MKNRIKGHTMSQRERSASSGHLVVHDATYRVVILKNPHPAHDHDVVHALCLEQNLNGRGADVPSALADLAQTVGDMITEEYASSLPEYESNTDPALVDAFEKRANEVEGCPVIRRGNLRVRLERTPVARGTTGKPRGKKSAATVLRAEEISFLPLVA